MKHAACAVVAGAVVVGAAGACLAQTTANERVAAWVSTGLSQDGWLLLASTTADGGRAEFIDLRDIGYDGYGTVTMWWRVEYMAERQGRALLDRVEVNCNNRRYQLTRRLSWTGQNMSGTMLYDIPPFGAAAGWREAVPRTTASLLVKTACDAVAEVNALPRNDGWRPGIR